jgi:hypothetical protein
MSSVKIDAFASTVIKGGERGAPPRSNSTESGPIVSLSDTVSRARRHTTRRGINVSELQAEPPKGCAKTIAPTRREKASLAAESPGSPSEFTRATSQRHEQFAAAASASARNVAPSIALRRSCA